MTGLFLSCIHNMSIASIIFYRLFFGLCLISIFLLITGRLGELKPGKRRTQLLLQGIFVLANMFFYFICVKKTCFSIGILLEYTALSGLFAGGIYAVVIMNIRILKRDYSEFAIAFWGTAISCLLMIPFAFETPLSVLASNLVPLLTFGVFSVGIGGILTTIGFANLKSQTGSLLALIEPVAGVFFDLTVLGVTLQAGTIAGCLLILVAAAVVSYNDFAKPSVKCKDSAESV